MKVCTYFLLFRILGYTHSFTSDIPKSNQRSVNLELETVLEFSNKEKEVDLNFLNKVQNFITNVKTVIDENSNGKNLRRNFNAPRIKTFTEFIQNVIHILNTFDDTAYTDFFDILDEEIRNYHYRGCKFYELTENYELRKLIAEKLDSIKGKPTFVVKANINALSDMLKDDNYDRNIQEILSYFNSLYRQEAEEDFQKVINDLVAYGRSKSKNSYSNLGKIIKNGVRSIIFDHYTNLNTNVRRDVKQRVETFWNQFKKNTPSRGNIQNVKPYSKSRKNAKNSEHFINGVKKPESVLRKYLMNNTSKKSSKNNKFIKKHENNKYKTEIKQVEYKKAEMKQDDVKSEKEQYKHNRKDIVDETLHIKEKEKRLSSQHTVPIIDQQRTKNEHQEQPNIGRLSGESFSSIEFYQEPQHKTMQYRTIIPKKVSQKPSTNVSKKLKKIIALNVTTRMPVNNIIEKIWIEESTGSLPKAVLDKLAIKPSGHESRHNMMSESLNKHSYKHKKQYDKDQKWHGKIYKPQYVKMYKKKDDKKHDKKRMTKHWSKKDIKYESTQEHKSTQDKKHKYDKISEANDPFILAHNRDFFRQNYVRTTESVFNMEVNQYRKSMGPSRVDLNQNKGWSATSTKAQKFVEVLDVLMPSKSGKTIKSPQARRAAAPRVRFNETSQQTSPPPPTNSSMRRLALAYSKNNTILSWKPEWYVKKSAEHPSSSEEGMTVETSEIKDGKERHEQNAERTSSSLEKDPNVIENVKNLERQLVTARKVTHSFGANDDVMKRKQTENRFRLDVNNFQNDYKAKQDKLKMAETVNNKPERIIENKYIKNEDSTKNEIDNIQIGKKSERKFKSDVNVVPNNFKDKTDKVKEAGKPDNKTDIKDKDFKNKEDLVALDSEIEKVTNQQEIIKKEKQSEISFTNIGGVSSKAKDKIVKVMMMNDHDGDDASKQIGTQNRKIASLSTSMKTTESTTKTTTTVQPTVAVTTPTTFKLSTVSISVPVATSHKLTDVLQKAKFNATVDNSKNRMANYNTSQVADVSKTTQQEN